ncbi:hypothetical protein P43SY_012113 [Pythium insidiosum]|uniref:Nudix hydrolase domain-containing protein n=1 Tax=Pythium insidiosum TaxID=114742 RepID=A0AAD5Q2B7_PYTIN|nr:hypothetical protein P43SY_012113 [Pythium insidiosum]
MELPKATATVSPLQQSRAGREQQRYDGKTRLLACVAIVDASAPERRVLLISSSKRPDEWILPKGGWESDETIEECALREAEEEAGVQGSVIRDLGELDFVNTKGSAHRLYGFVLQCIHQYDHWAEQSRRREWVSFDEALVRLEQRPELCAILTRAKSALT